MSDEKPKTRRGPKLKGPTTEKDIKIFENLCKIQCTLRELAAAFEVDEHTLIKRIEEWYGRKFSSVFNEKKEGGRISLRRSQWQTAIDKHNVTMQIFLGKNYLGQTDRPEELLRNKEPMVYATKIGESGEILTEISTRDEWEAKKDFDATSILKAEDDKSKPKRKAKAKAKKKKAKKSKAK